MIYVWYLPEVQEDVIISGCGQSTHNLWAANVLSLPIYNTCVFVVKFSVSDQIEVRQ